MRARLYGAKNMAELCQEFGISRVCSYKWYGRFLKGGFVGLVEHSRQARAGVRLR